jgi:regulatory protein YycI of two-component signal transduction system YycFG
VHLDGQGECSTQTAVSIFLVSIFLVSIFLVSIFLSSAVGEDALQLRYFDGVTQA